LKVFLLVGQSNMAGRGKVEDADRKPHARVLTLDKANTWVPAIDPLHFDKPQIAGVGLGKTFGEAIAEANNDATIGLVPCAVGGTSIQQWSPTLRDGLFATAIARAQVALKHGELAGILWHQGESDSKKTDGYLEKAVGLFEAFRTQLAGGRAVPLVVGEIGRFHANEAGINAVIRQIPLKVKVCAVVDATGLNHKGDSVHFDAAAYRELGKRYAAKWTELAHAAK
jgi:hypothetical protein